MSQVDAAEKEASEVLHSLLSVERIEKQEVIIDGTEEANQSTHTFVANAITGNEANEGESQIQWHTPVSISHSLFSAIEANNHFPETMDDQQVVVFNPNTMRYFKFKLYIKR